MVASLIRNHFTFYTSYMGMNLTNVLGFVLMMLMVLQIGSGILLSSYYSAYYTIAFDSIEYIMVEVGIGMMIRFIHGFGSSLIMFFLMLHLIRGYWLRLKSIDSLNLVWFSGLFTLIIVMLESFIGYLLIWGKMSYWGVTVMINIVSGVVTSIFELFTSLLSLLSVFGLYFNVDSWLLFSSNFVASLTGFIWCSVYSITLRLFVVHFALGFVIIGLIIAHIFILHSFSGSNPLLNSNSISFPFFPIIVYKDFFIFSLCFALMSFVLFIDYEVIFGNPDNLVKATSLSTPQHILPEWYFLIYYCWLRCFSSKVIGVLMVISWFILVI